MDGNRGVCTQICAAPRPPSGVWLMLPSTPSYMAWAPRTHGACHPMWDILHGLVLHGFLATISGPFSCLAGGISADRNSTRSSTGNLSDPLGSFPTHVPRVPPIPAGYATKVPVPCRAGDVPSPTGLLHHKGNSQAVTSSMAFPQPCTFPLPLQSWIHFVFPKHTHGFPLHLQSTLHEQAVPWDPVLGSSTERLCHFHLWGIKHELCNPDEPSTSPALVPKHRQK